MSDNRLVRKLFHFYWRFSRPLTVGVRAIVEDETGRVLLVRHTYVSGWYLPGGGIEKRESAGEAIRKELLEETNVEIAAQPRLVGIYQNFRASPRDHVLLYHVESWKQAGTFRPNREIAEIGFFDPRELPPDTTPATRRRLLEILGGEPVSDRW